MTRFMTLFAILATTACSGVTTNQASNKETRLYVLDCGDILVRDISVFSPGIDKGVEKNLVNRCYLIQNKGKNFLWDTGLSDSTPAEGMDAGGGGFRLSVKNPLMKQLKNLGLAAKDIDLVGVSHYHFDHTGNLNNFVDAKILIQQEEFDAAYSSKAKEYNFVPDSYSKINKNQYVKLKGDHDVFGDGRVVIKRAAGHTPGHQLLFVNLPESGPIVLSGDVTHFTKNWEHSRIPSFNFDKDISAQAIKHTKAFVAEKKAQFWIQHDKEQNASIKLAPAFYK